MVVHYQGESSQSKQMPGGGPQGTIIIKMFITFPNKPLLSYYYYYYYKIVKGKLPYSRDAALLCVFFNEL